MLGRRIKTYLIFVGHLAAAKVATLSVERLSQELSRVGGWWALAWLQLVRFATGSGSTAIKTDYIKDGEASCDSVEVVALTGLTLL